MPVLREAWERETLRFSFPRLCLECILVAAWTLSSKNKNLVDIRAEPYRMRSQAEPWRLNCYDKNKNIFIRYTKDNGFPSNAIRTIQQYSGWGLYT